MTVGRAQVVDSSKCLSPSGEHVDTMHLRLVRDPPMDVQYCKVCGSLGPMKGPGYTTLSSWIAPSGNPAEPFRAAQLEERSAAEVISDRERR